jgi:SAM-dependent methyltransferase
MPPASAAQAFGLDKEALWSTDSNRGPYAPSPWRVLRRILRPAEVSSADVFLDLGSGTGRVVLEAATAYPFRRVIGVELVPRLTEIARETIARNSHRLRCQDVELISADLADYEIPDDVTVVYLFNPFWGSLFDVIVAKLIASLDDRPRRLRLIYLTPTESARLEQTGRMRFVRHGRHRIRRWARLEYLAMYEIEPRGG